MRKFALSAVALLFSLGLTLAAEVTFVKFDKEKKEVVVKEGEDEKTYKITDDTKFYMMAKGEKKDVPAEKAMERLEKANDSKRKPKMDVKTEGTKLTTVEFKAGGKKGPDKN